jgi:hypothetical protein
MELEAPVEPDLVESLAEVVGRLSAGDVAECVDDRIEFAARPDA